MSSEQLFKKSPSQALTYYYISEGLSFIVNIIIAIVLMFLWSHFDWWHFIFYLICAFILFDIVYAVLKPWITYRYTYFRIMENYIEIKFDFFFKTQKIVKLERTQFTERKNNPILKKLGLARVSLVTAGHRVSFPLLSIEDSKAFESMTLDYLRGADFDV
ncbi:PH domain-containing protein [Staphylococcus xylosus]|uniref:PH domain-containing protein n=1 Tax=Staphylococcus xylosus TaxID=1288 RepID=UPI003202ABD1